MKKFGIILVCLTLMGSLVSCGGDKPVQKPRTDAPVTTEDPGIQSPDDLLVPQADTLVIYFSRVGNTDFPEDVDVVSSASLNRTDGELKGNAQLMAEWMADETGGDLLEIQTEYAYPADYNAATDVARQEQNGRARPTLRSQIGSMARYSTVHLVCPIWWGDLPMAVYSFFDSHDLAGKTIIVSVTHEGSGFARTVDTVRRLEPAAEVIEGLALQGGAVAVSEGVVRQFVRDIH